MKKATLLKVMALLDETCNMDNLVIVKGKQMYCYGPMGLNSEYEPTSAPLVETKPNTRDDLDKYEMAVLYDGGYMHSVMSCEYGCEANERFMDKLNTILGEAGLGCEIWDSTSFIIHNNK